LAREQLTGRFRKRQANPIPPPFSSCACDARLVYLLSSSRFENLLCRWVGVL